MPKIQIRLTEKENKKVNIVKSIKGFKTKVEAVKEMIKDYKIPKIES